jgi:hypothetical protein
LINFNTPVVIFCSCRTIYFPHNLFSKVISLICDTTPYFISHLLNCRFYSALKIQCSESFMFTQKETLMFTQKETPIFTQKETVMFKQKETFMFTQKKTLISHKPLLSYPSFLPVSFRHLSGANESENAGS